MMQAMAAPTMMPNTFPMMQQQHMMGAAMPGMTMPGGMLGGMPGMPGMPGTMPGMMPGMMYPPPAANPFGTGDQDTESEEDGEHLAVVPSQSAHAAPPAAAPAVPAVPAVPAAAMAAPAQPALGFQDPNMGFGLYNKSDHALITRSSSMLRQLPRIRLVAALEKLDPEVDAGYVANLSQKGVVILLWLYTRLRPATKMGHLRALVGTELGNSELVI